MTQVVFVSDNSLACLGSCINAVLSNTRAWLIVSQLTLSEQKTEYNFFHKHLSYYVWPSDLHLGDTINKRVRESKFLSVYIDDKVSWVRHVDHVSRSFFF